jgi:hypothetical protein
MLSRFEGEPLFPASADLLSCLLDMVRTRSDALLLDLLGAPRITLGALVLQISTLHLHLGPLFGASYCIQDFVTSHLSTSMFPFWLLTSPWRRILPDAQSSLT